jgi:hypothetical protein
MRMLQSQQIHSVVVTNLYDNGLCTKAPQNESGDPLCLLLASYSLPLSFAIASLLMYGTRDAAD